VFPSAGALARVIASIYQDAGTQTPPPPRLGMVVRVVPVVIRIACANMLLAV
jgi:hypothetical protein